MNRFLNLGATVFGKRKTVFSSAHIADTNIHKILPVVVNCTSLKRFTLNCWCDWYLFKLFTMA